MIYLDIEETSMSNITLRKLQSVSGRWAARNFGDKRPTYHPLLGISEEVGELCHAHLKKEQGIRGTTDELNAQAKDAVGDIVIFLADYCNLNGFDLQDSVDSAWSEVSKRDWTVNRDSGFVKDALADDGMNQCIDDCESCSCEKKSYFSLEVDSPDDIDFDREDESGKGQE
jgi:NTP pyrophosphatase (non-canonical NTP hydrolase)